MCVTLTTGGPMLLEHRFLVALAISQMPPADRHDVWRAVERARKRRGPDLVLRTLQHELDRHVEQTLNELEAADVDIPGR